MGTYRHQNHRLSYLRRQSPWDPPNVSDIGFFGRQGPFGTVDSGGRKVHLDKISSATPPLEQGTYRSASNEVQHLELSTDVPQLIQNRRMCTLFLCNTVRRLKTLRHLYCQTRCLDNVLPLTRPTSDFELALCSWPCANLVLAPRVSEYQYVGAV